jgi:adenylate cyclase
MTGQRGSSSPKTLEDEWRDYLMGTHPEILRGRRTFGLLPSDPRCRACHSPFHGIGSLLMRNFGYTPWEKNPHICKRCVTRFSKRGIAGAEIELTMLFADVRGSTELAERTSGTAFSALINRFYEVGSSVLIDHDALIDKFVGDEIIGLFIPLLTGELHAARAIEAAQDLLRQTGHADPSGPWIPLGVGVHTGIARVGMVGTPGAVMDFTALGDSVNTASRLASNATTGEVLVSDAGIRAANFDIGGREHRDLRLKGKAEPVGATVLRVASGEAPVPSAR